jgi:hypothetical protein
MAKIDLNTVSSGYLSQAALNANFTAIENEFQNKVLYRDNPSGEPNSMQSNLDMNGYYVLNAGNTSLADAGNIAYTFDDSAAESRTISDKLNEFVSVKDFGAIGDGVTDDTAAIQACFTKAVSAGQKRVHIPEGQYVLSNKITITGSLDITCDKSASLRWTISNSANCGILLDFADGADTLCSIELPQLFSPAVTSSYTIPGYSSGSGWNYNLASRVGSAVHIKGGDRINLYLHYAKGWTDAIKVEPTTTKTCDNYDIRMGVADFCEYGLRVVNAGVGSLGVAQMNFRANTIWAKFPLYFDTTNGYVISSRFEIDGVFVNEDGGCVIYGAGTGVRGSTIRVNWADAGKRADSVPATTANLRCPYLGGDQGSNGFLYDGMGTSPNIGYWGSNHCEISVGAAFDYIGTDFGAGSPIPAAGHTIRIRDGGRHNVVSVIYADYETNLTNAPIALTGTQGEANYNGGVGGAQFARTVYSQAVISSLAAGSSVWFYAYHQCVSGQAVRPVHVAFRNEGALDNGIEVQAYQNNAVNREIKVRIKNTGASSFTGNAFFWLVVGD